MSVADKLAINGGKPVRTGPMPSRRAIGPKERQTIMEVLDYYDELGLDPGYQGYFEDKYCDAFCTYQGGGYADAVATGTISIYVAIKALQLPPGSEILVSPITDAGSISAIIEAGYRPKLMDAASWSYNSSASCVEERLSNSVSAVLIVHATGKAADIAAIAELTKRYKVKLIEDCSQSHGASCDGEKIGCFGDIAAFSTMYRKCSIAGGSGGIVYTRNRELYNMALAYADRGKPSWRENFDFRDPNGFLFPALNLHTDEISCGIGVSSLGRLDETRAKRLVYVQAVAEGLRNRNSICVAQQFDETDSPFICPIFLDLEQLTCSKIDFAKAVRAEGIDLNPHYMYLVRDWPWLKDYLADKSDTLVAREMRDSSFCLYVNENYGLREVEDTLKALQKVENYYKKLS